MFCAMLGTVADNFMLTLVARGGIYIASGIVPKLDDGFAQSQFRARFEAKGRSAPISRRSRPTSSCTPGRSCLVLPSR